MSEIRIASISGLRGVVGNGIDPATAATFAAAYASSRPEGAIVVGHDGRPSAPVFLPAVTSAIAATGRDVVSVGPAATPTIGVLVRDLGAVGGVQISASHNPPEYNGLKFFQPEGMVLGPEDGREVVARWERDEYGWVDYRRIGSIRTRLDDVDGGHLSRVLAAVDPEAIRRRKFVVALDSGHGAGGRLGARLLRDLGCQAIILGGEPDGQYDHPPEPTESNLARFAAVVPAIGAAVGFAQDPDADRLAIIDEQGRYIGEELTLALAAAHMLTARRGPLILNLSTSLVSERLARHLGCHVHRTPVGEIHVVERMRAEGAVLGGEGNGGVIDPRVGFVRDSFVGMALVLDFMAATREPLSALVDRLPKFSMVKEKYPRGETPIAAVFDRIAEAHPDAAIDRRDGLRLAWDECWVHVRTSNTEPIVRVIAEAEDRDRAHELANLIGRWVRES